MKLKQLIERTSCIYNFVIYDGYTIVFSGRSIDIPQELTHRSVTFFEIIINKSKFYIEVNLA